MKYLGGKFSVAVGGEAFAEGWERTFKAGQDLLPEHPKTGCNLPGRDHREQEEFELDAVNVEGWDANGSPA
jgi:hypothetical protein